MFDLEFVVATIRHDRRGDDLIVTTDKFVSLGEAQAFAGQVVDVPLEDRDSRTVKYLRQIRRSKAPGLTLAERKIA